jgi:hypothetical protein
MAFVHGKSTYISLDGDNLSAYANQSDLARTAGSHNVTTFGNDSNVYQGGLLDGTATISGIYDNTALTGPRAVIEPLIGTVVAFVRRPEGTGTGKPQDSCNVLVTGYTETNPVADMVTWQADLQISGDVTSAAQA